MDLRVLVSWFSKLDVVVSANMMFGWRCRIFREAQTSMTLLSTKFAYPPSPPAKGPKMRKNGTKTVKSIENPQS